MEQPIEPVEAAKLIQQEAESSAETYRQLYAEWQGLVSQGGHGSCCDRQTCYRARAEDELIKDMRCRLRPSYRSCQ